MSSFNARLAVVVCTPMAKIANADGALVYEPLDPRWHRGRMQLSFGTNINTSEMSVDGMEVGDARSRVAGRVVQMSPKPFCVFFLDSDVVVAPDSFTKLFYHLKTRPEIDIACGVYVAKGSPPFEPLIYQGNGMGAFWDFAVGDILTTKTHGITGCHMGLTLIRSTLFDRLLKARLVNGDGIDQGDKPFFCTEQYRRDTPKGVETYRGTEDLFFCHLGAQLDPPLQILVDTSVLAGHVDRKTGICYGLPGDCSPIERAMWMPLPDGSGRRKDRVAADKDGKLIAIDLGAGESRREWEGYVTYTLDSRKDSGADYCQPMEALNLPPDHYDLVASRHAFEHVARFDQERLWQQAFMICKPGGKIEIIVPNVEWAAAKIQAGEFDLHVMNVLYGGQEGSPGLPREENTHKFGYTPKIARALAEGAGFVDVEIADFRSNPELCYHLILKARKPAPEPTDGDNFLPDQHDK